MPARLADRLRSVRQRQFVGRTTEQALFRDALVAHEMPFAVLYMFGPGGVGKTTLLGAFARICDEQEYPSILLDAREIEPAPEPFLAALRQVLGLAPDESPLLALAAQPGRQAILIDTYEALLPLDGWLRDTFLPQLSGQTLIVLAGRESPAPAWRSDPGWQHLVHLLPLRNFRPEESLAYLNQRSVPTDQHASVLRFTHGHPLALSLVADTFAQREHVTFQAEAAPDIVKVLLERFVTKVPGPAHRTALEACALVRLTTEALLAEMLTFPDGRELFEWLRDLSFVEAGRQGLFPHDLAREALVADLRWRNPDWYRTLSDRARRYYRTRLQQVGRAEQQRILLDYAFLYRDNPALHPFYVWNVVSAPASLPRDEDWGQLRAIVARYEGPESAELADYWFRRQPEGVTVFHNEAQRPVGFLATIALERTDAADYVRDPAVGRACEMLAQRAALRAGENATFVRFWMADETYQAVSAIQNLIFVSIVQQILSAAGVAYTLVACAEPELWAPLFAYADLERIKEADFEVGGRRYGCYGHDWRTTPLAAWLGLLASRETSAEQGAMAMPAPPPQPTPLSEPEFATAVRSALRDFTRPGTLAENPLLQSRLVLERSGPAASIAERVAALQALLREVSETLQASPRDARYYRVLYHSFLLPAQTQEQAAELLNLPFSTYRRYLKTALTLVSEQLWQREIQGG